MTRMAAITATGSVTTAGIGSASMLAALNQGKVLARLNSDLPKMPPYWTARAPENSALEAGLKGLSFPRPSRTSLLAMAAIQECWNSSGLTEEIELTRAGCAMSRNFAQHDVVAQYYGVLWEKGPAAVSGLQFVQTIGNTVLGKVSLDLHLRGPSILNIGAPVLGLALDILRDGDADWIFAGGVDELSQYALTRIYLDFNGAPADDPFGPYDARCSGMIPGEGAAFLLLENPQIAQSRGAAIKGYLRGHATVTDRSWNSFLRNADDVAECIRRALDDASITPAAVTVICGSGTRLPGFDSAELLAIEQVFPNPPQLYSIKGALGDTWGASAYLSAISLLEVLATGVAPAAAGTSQLDPNRRVPVIVGSSQPVAPGAALVLSCDMSGHNSAYVLTLHP
jgi:3-oxoacyl-(acyl-carrier-protein) synthase